MRPRTAFCPQEICNSSKEIGFIIRNRSELNSSVGIQGSIIHRQTYSHRLQSDRVLIHICVRKHLFFPKCKGAWKGDVCARVLFCSSCVTRWGARQETPPLCRSLLHNLWLHSPKSSWRRTTGAGRQTLDKQGEVRKRLTPGWEPSTWE